MITRDSLLVAHSEKNNNLLHIGLIVKFSIISAAVAVFILASLPCTRMWTEVVLGRLLVWIAHTYCPSSVMSTFSILIVNSSWLRVTKLTLGSIDHLSSPAYSILDRLSHAVCVTTSPSAHLWKNKNNTESRVIFKIQWFPWGGTHGNHKNIIYMINPSPLCIDLFFLNDKLVFINSFFPCFFELKACTLLHATFMIQKCADAHKSWTSGMTQCRERGLCSWI